MVASTQKDDIDYFKVLALWRNDQLFARQLSLLWKLFDPRCNGLECNANRVLLNEWIVCTRERFFTQGYNSSLFFFFFFDLPLYHHVHGTIRHFITTDGNFFKIFLKDSCGRVFPF